MTVTLHDHPKERLTMNSSIFVVLGVSRDALVTVVGHVNLFHRDSVGDTLIRYLVFCGDCTY